MDLMDAELKSGCLHGICINHLLTILYRLFADDLRIFIPATLQAFNELKTILSCYETASGARLNLQKSVVIPFALKEIPEWLRETGCIIIKSGEVQRYLGAPIGVDLRSDQLHQFCLEKIGKRLSSWSLRLLSFSGRLILIKHVLQAIPIYHMMFIKSSEKLAKKMVALSWDFLWGHNAEGGKRIPLIAWERLAWPKSEGGVGLKDFRSHSDTLLTQWFTKALDSPDSDWANTLFDANLSSAMWFNAKVIQWNRYTVRDRLLLSNP